MMQADCKDIQSIIRPAHIRDHRQLCDIAIQAYQHYLPLMPRAPAPMHADFKRHIKDDLVFVCTRTGLETSEEEPQQPIGYLVAISRDHGWWLDNIAIHPHFQNRGLGRSLIDRLEQWFHTHHITSYQLYTNQIMTCNIAWYKRHGFVEIDQRTEDGYQRIYFEKKLSSDRLEISTNCHDQSCA
ncbi:MAG: GNAT family N-acetyltransferase [Pseudomonadota bacterium]